MTTLLLQIGLYAFGPFFGNPFKPVIAALATDTPYLLGYKHFYDQHKTPANLIWHVICLFFQIFSNFAFLASLDNLLQPFTGTATLLTSSTALCWIVFLLIPTTCPAIVKVHSVVWILLAYAFATSIQPLHIELISYACFFIVWVVHVIMRGGVIRHCKGASLIIVALVGKMGMLQALHAAQYSGMLENSSTLLISAYLVGLVVISGILADPVKGVVAYGAVGAPLVALLVNSPVLHLFGYAYVATALQGLAHSLSGEEATLLKLQGLGDKDAAHKISYEWAHVTFFPNLLGHALYDTLKSTRRKGLLRVPRSSSAHVGTAGSGKKH
jgi:hypothetical protein